jgi:hypothetical protein
MKYNAFLTTTAAAALVVATLGLAGGAKAEQLSASPQQGLMLLAEAGQPAEHPILQLSEEGLKALRAVYAARLAIFEGETKEAEKLLSHAKAELGEAAKTAEKIAFKSKKAYTGTLIPIDARLTLADDFVFTPEKAAKIAKVNEHLKKGETKQALEMLRDAGIYLNLTAVLLPLEPTTSAVDKAIKLLGEDKYYEANLALKAAEDGVIIDSQSFIEWLEAAPGQAKKS